MNDSRGERYHSGMVILAADTSTPYYSVAVVRGGEVLGEVAICGGRRHSERMLETTRWLLEEVRIQGPELDGLAVSVGPGSFTGLRVGVSAWKGLALGWGLPLFGVGTLDALALNAGAASGSICPALDAKMAEVFFGAYQIDGDALISVHEPMVASVQTMLERVPEDCVFLGDGADRYRDEILAVRPAAELLGGLHSYPRAASVGILGARMAMSGDTGDAAAVEPVYLRGSQAEEMKKAVAAP